ncbi:MULTISPECIES: hypothetical protein [Streptomyces]|jgi:hypothetical protein|uniref:Integral membrane protein n=1 Tax=Streptomyces pharetrae CZA14 TaxID=1144883 RepID=A0ABX3YRG7_9ACTN|nr:hypothetical protein [Streptomyces glaucescens]OSZ61617.1 hypothetical protein OQI_04200 [Streptomyces pharetrae CZA14]
MSFGDPNNPYGQPPQQPPAGAPGYGYPQQPPGVPPQANYGYPQQPAYPGYPGGNMMLPQSMPGLLVTARVFLFIISAVQILGALAFLYFAAFASDVSDGADELGFSSVGDGGDAAAGIFAIFALIAAALAALSITLGVKFGRGGQGIRITTVIYGALGAIVGLVGLFVGLDTGMASSVIGPLLWLVFGGIIAAAPVVPSGTAWFARPRY